MAEEPVEDGEADEDHVPADGAARGQVLLPQLLLLDHHAGPPAVPRREVAHADVHGLALGGLGRDVGDEARDHHQAHQDNAGSSHRLLLKQ